MKISSDGLNTLIDFNKGHGVSRPLFNYYTDAMLYRRFVGLPISSYVWIVWK